MTTPSDEAALVTVGERRSRLELALEEMALRHQIAVLKRSGTRRPCFRSWDRLFWILLSWWWPRWLQTLMIVQPETVVRWRRDVGSVFWRYRARGRWRGGRPRVSREVRALIVRMARENFLWGAPRIHGELLLGFEVSQATVSRYLSTVYRRPGQSWRTFIRNQAIAFRLNQTLEQDSDSDSKSLRLRNRSSGGGAGWPGLNAARGYCASSSPYRVQRLGRAPRRSRNACANHFPIQVSMRSPPYRTRASPWLRRRTYGGFTRIKF